MAKTVVAEALSKINDQLSQSSPCDVDERVEDLVIELRWMQCFLMDSERTPEGQAKIDIWSPNIVRFALCAKDIQSNWINPGLKVLGIEKLTKRFATLREKLHPFVCGSSSYVAKVPDALPAVKLPEEIKMAACGGTGGQKWDFKPKGILSQITISCGEVIDSLTFTCHGPDGSVESTLKVGGTGGSHISQIKINGPWEYLTCLSGTYRRYNNIFVISSLKFKTNMAAYGPYGSTSGFPFEFMMESGGEIVGFHGNSSNVVDSVGVYFKPK